MSAKEQLMRLWKETFGDSDDFIQLFFNRVHREENAITITQQGKVISALHVVPYSMNLTGNIIRGGYICGVATLPEERGKGYMRALMASTEKKMQERGYEFLSLIPAQPWLFDYYRKLGYHNFFYYSTQTHRFSGDITDKNCLIYTDIRKIPIQQFYDFFSKKVNCRNGYLIHTLDNFVTILQDLFLSEGNLYTFENETGLSGMAFVYREENDVLVKEIVFDNESVKKRLLDYISSGNKNADIKYRLPAIPEKCIPYGMIQWINPGVLNGEVPQHGYMSLMLD